MGHNIDWRLISKLCILAIMSTVMVLMFVSVNGIDERSGTVEATHIEEILRKAAIQCYALEGAYPPDIDYLTNYGITLDKKNFVYYYETNTIGNYMPDISVIER